MNKFLTYGLSALLAYTPMSSSAAPRPENSLPIPGRKTTTTMPGSKTDELKLGNETFYVLRTPPNQEGLVTIGDKQTRVKDCVYLVRRKDTYTEGSGNNQEVVLNPFVRKFFLTPVNYEGDQFNPVKEGDRDKEEKLRIDTLEETTKERTRKSFGDKLVRTLHRTINRDKTYEIGDKRMHLIGLDSELAKTIPQDVLELMTNREDVVAFMPDGKSFYRIIPSDEKEVSVEFWQQGKLHLLLRGSLVDRVVEVKADKPEEKKPVKTIADKIE